MNEQLIKSTTELLASMTEVIRKQEARISELEGKAKAKDKHAEELKDEKETEKVLNETMKNLKF